jgi:hypothetical protein
MSVPFCELTAFLHFWLTLKPIEPPLEDMLDFSGNLSGLVLYRSGQYQVQLFIIKEDAIIKAHCHPNVDSYEVTVSGKVAFEVNGFRHEDRALWDHVRVLPDAMHTAYIGKGGGAFISVQKWLNGVKPSSVGWDWADQEGRTSGSADPTTPSTFFMVKEDVVVIDPKYYEPSTFGHG